jgi:predicted dehydrogenase
MKKIRLGVVGAGFMGKLHVQCAAGLEAVTLSAIIDPDAERGSKLVDTFGGRHYTDAEAALAADAADAYVVALPDRLHGEVTMRLLDAGKPVLVEKPMADRLETARSMALAAQRSGRLMVGHILRFDPRYVQAAQAVREGRIGDPLHGSSGRFTNSSLGVRMKSTTDIVLHLGVHDIDALQWIAGADIKRVVSRTVSKLMPSLGVASEDACFTTCEMTKGMVGQLYCGWTLPDSAPTGIWARTEVIGTQGLIDLDVRDGGLRVHSSGSWTLPDCAHWPSVNGRIMGDLYEEQRHFFEAIRDEKPFAISIEDGLRAVAVSDAIVKSVATGQAEDVADWAV